MKQFGKQFSKGQRGFTMIELLVAVLVVAVGLLGVAGMQVYSLENNHMAYLRSQAAIFTYDITDRMRANYPAALNGDYDIAVGTTTPTTGGTIANDDLIAWLTNLANTLPQGDGGIAVTADGVATITIQWIDDKDVADKDGVAIPQTYQLVTRL